MFHSKNKRYFMLASFNYLEAHNFENGGIRPDSTDGKPDDKNNLFNNQLEKVWFASQSVRSLDKRYNYRVYQHYDILPNEKMQLFYRFDYSYRVNRYDDNALALNNNFYQKFTAYTAPGRYSFEQIADRTDFNLFDNRLGLKGSVNTVFYSAYVKNRYVTRHQGRIVSYLTPFDTYSNEWYAGGQLRKYFDSTKTSYVESLGEYQISNSLADKNNYTASANLMYNGFNIQASIWAVSPSMLQSGYRSNLISWDSSFQLQTTKRLFVQYAFTKRKMDIIPSIAFNNYTNLIYFTEAGTPTQFKDGAVMHIQPKLGLRFNVWKIHIYNEFQYNCFNSDISKGKEILQMPAYVNATQLFIEAWLFKRATLLQTGFDVSYRNSYRANGYNPLIQQYFVTTEPAQNIKGGSKDFNYIDQYVVVDFFVNMQIRTARLFIKMSNFARGWGQPKGYFTTPYYTGIPTTLDFGVSWRFFD